MWTTADLRAWARRRTGEPQLLSTGWDKYARRWRAERCEVTDARGVAYLGDEWTIEDRERTGSSYGLPPEALERFGEYLARELVEPYLPAAAEQGLEIGPGGGRFTELLLPRTQVLHVADAAKGMLAHVKRRFAGDPRLRFHHTDGMSLPPLAPASLDYVASFDVFVHFEPRLVYWYLRQMHGVLKPGGVGLIHYANACTPLGFEQFERHVAANLKRRTFFAAFGVMSPDLMTQFLESLNFEIVEGALPTIPRDAIAIFRKPH